MSEDKQLGAEQADIVAINLQGGPVLIVRFQDEDREWFLGSDSGVDGFSLRTVEAREVLTRTRAVARGLVCGDKNPDLRIPPRPGSQFEVLAEFCGTSGNLRWVSDDAPESWSLLARSARRSSFVMRPADLRIIRNLSDEPYPGVLRSPFGEIAVHHNGKWWPVDEMDAEDVATEVIPRVRAHLGSRATDNAVLLALLGLTSPDVAQDALAG